ncbi:MAG TPA: hypothetical protein VFY99_08995 [Solirubrobacterales bacterium]
MSMPPSQPPPGAEPEHPFEPVHAAAAPVPLDDDDTRGAHLRALLRHPVTISLTISGVIAGFVIGTLAAGAPIGGAAAGGVLVLALIIVWVLASGRAKEDFLNAYAGARGLVRQGKGDLAPMTPLLQRGDRRYASERMTGHLAGVEPGTLAHYTYEVRSTDSEGNQETTYYHFTVGICSVPESAVKAGELYCQRRFGFRFLDGFEDAFRRKQRVEVESEVMDKRFETFADADADPNWLRQLFSPSFIVWLGEQAPKDFAFELVAGGLVANVKGHLDSAAELDAFCEATATVAKRLREESVEQPVGGPTPGAAPPA